MSDHMWKVTKTSTFTSSIDCWICRVCGASGGPVWSVSGPDWGKASGIVKPFISGTPILLTENCEESMVLMIEAIGKYPEYQTKVDQELARAERATGIEPVA